MENVNCRHFPSIFPFFLTNIAAAFVLGRGERATLKPNDGHAICRAPE